MRRAALVLSLVLAALAAACGEVAGPATSEAEILDGAPTTEHPAVGVVHQSVAESFCTGTLIAPDIVLTAGHCIEGDEKIDAFFTGGGRPVASPSTDPSTLGMVRHEVVAQVPYPTFDYFYSCPNQALDIALVRLAEPITDIEPVKIGGPPLSAAECTTVGFGTHETDGGEQFLEKRAATVKIGDVRETSLDIFAVDGIASHGDSGGPLLCGDVIVATTSCQPDWPYDAIAYGNLSAGLSWITAMIAQWEP